MSPLRAEGAPAPSGSRHIAFFNIPATGHLTPTLGVVEELVRRGHRVTYAATEEYADLIASTGATVLPYTSSIDPQKIVPAGADDWLARVLEGNVREGAATAPVFEEYFRSRGELPDLLAYDISVQFLGGVLTRKWNRPGVKFYSVSPTNRSIPREAVGAAAYDRIESELVAFAGAHGVRDVSFDLLVDDPQALNVVSVPREFQYRGEEFDEDGFVFVGPCLRERERVVDPSSGWQPPASGLPVVLISLGTSFNAQPDFFRRCVAALASGGKWHTVLVTGPGVDAASLGPLPDDVEVHAWLPLQEVLAHTRVFVCHGGWGTVMQSLHAGTPMVVVPQVGETDQLAHQIGALNLGTVLSREEATVPALREAVASVDADAGLRESVARMREHVHAAGGASRAADALLNRLPARVG
ncbi:macrolide family glycosyltransferase [Streptomyces sp. CA-294286]|uniref:macrolide family glycosyltransferase n=1 Tax=Streptomyces sp. CA-294286 TaxID=3240070 RepID=UPI003D89EA0D